MRDEWRAGTKSGRLSSACSRAARRTYTYVYPKYKYKHYRWLKSFIATNFFIETGDVATATFGTCTFAALNLLTTEIEYCIDDFVGIDLLEANCNPNSVFRQMQLFSFLHCASRETKMRVFVNPPPAQLLWNSCPRALNHYEYY